MTVAELIEKLKAMPQDVPVQLSEPMDELDYDATRNGGIVVRDEELPGFGVYVEVIG